MDKLPLNFGLLCGGFFFLITFAIGLILLLININSKKKAGASQNWPSTRGTIVISEVRQSANTDEDGHTRYAFYPHVEYTYRVADQIYKSRQIAFGGSQGTSSPNPAQQILSKYPVQADVAVYFNPQKPAETVLERTLGSGGKTARTMAIILLILSGLIACPLLIGVIRNFF